MFSLFKKEVISFFSSLTGYIVLVVFLTAIGLLLWVIPGTGLNILENGYATLETLFIIAPWLFLFLIPAITMKMFAEEKKSGTLELLLTKPITDLHIVFSKYLSALILVLSACIPTINFFITVYSLASPAGNVDVAGTSGSYFGLVFLCSAFVSIGIFSSAISNNQVIAFITALLLSFFIYSGFNFLSTTVSHPVFSNILDQIGMEHHFISLSRGVIDSRDIIYFLSITIFFLLMSGFILEKRKWQ